jgi:predicted CoA-binding protein
MGPFAAAPSIHATFELLGNPRLFGRILPCQPLQVPTVAILGASSNRTKFGNKAVRAFRDCGWTVLPVNPRETAVEGLPCLSGSDAIPPGVDVVSAYLPPGVLWIELETLARKGCAELWLNPGTDTADVLEKCRQLGLVVVQDCSIVRLGRHPQDYP